MDNQTPIKEFNKCINALALELPEAVWNDVHFRWIELQNAIKASPAHTEVTDKRVWYTEQDLVDMVELVLCGDYRLNPHSEENRWRHKDTLNERTRYLPDGINTVCIIFSFLIL